MQVQGCIDTREKSLLVLTPDYPDATDTYIGGIFVKNYLDAIKHQFREIVVIAPVFFSAGILGGDRLCRDYQYDNIRVFFPRCFFAPRCLRIPLLHRIRLSLDLRLFCVEQCIKKMGLTFDLIHAHFTWPSAYIAIKLKEKYGKPVVATIHEDPDWLMEEVQGGHPLIVSAWMNADVLIRINPEDSDILKDYNPHVVMLPNGYAHIFRPLDRQQCRAELGLPEERKIILSVGMLEEIKGHRFLVGAIREILRKRTDVLCVIVGDGPRRSELEQQLKDEGLLKYVMLAGNRPHTEIPIWMNACDLLVLPSLNESFGVVQIEALACGKPVVATRTFGSKAIIRSERYGLLCEPMNPDDLAAKILLALDRDWQQEEILAYAVEYSWERISGDVTKPVRAGAGG